MGKSRNQMNPLEEKLLELLEGNAEQNGINSLHYLEALCTLSRSTTYVFQCRKEHIEKLMKTKTGEENNEDELFDKLTQTLCVYINQWQKLDDLSKEIEKIRKFQEGSNWFDDLLQSERKNT
jgi:hypothetical protein